MSPDNEDQIRFIRPRNDADIEALISKYHRLLLVVAVGMLRIAMSPEAAAEEAKDVLQEVYRDVWKKGIQGVEKSLLGYLIRTTRYKAIDRLRRNRPYVELDETMPDGRTDLEKDVELNDLVERVFSEMTPEDQQILRDSSEGHSGKDNASSKGINPNTKRSKEFRARRRFKLIFDKLKKEKPQS